jgi:hypothetical protein
MVAGYGLAAAPEVTEMGDSFRYCEAVSVIESTAVLWAPSEVPADGAVNKRLTVSVDSAEKSEQTCTFVVLLISPAMKVTVCDVVT